LYVINQNPTELYYERYELLLREARDARLARRLRAARRKANPRVRSRRSAEFLRRDFALWGRTAVPFFRA
jgi:hypothetical protein